VTAAGKWPGRPAFDFYDRVLTFGELHDLARRAAAGLQRLGVSQGSKVGLHLPNTPHYPICFFGALMAGACVVNLGPLSGLRELKYQIENASVRCMVTIDMPMFLPAAATLLAGRILDTLVICNVDDFLQEAARATLKVARVRAPPSQGQQERFADLIDRGTQLEIPQRGPLEEELAVLQYTGGTTGRPKASMLTHGNFSALLKLSARVGAALSRGMPRPQGITPRRLVVMPLSHIGGLGFGVLQQQLSGTENVLHLGFDAGRVLEDIERKRITEFAAVPSMYSALINHPRFRETDMGSLQLWGFSGAPMPRSVAQAFHDRVGTPTHQVYGLTETTGCTTFQYVAGGAPSTDTIGLPMPLTIIDIVDPESGLTVLDTGKAGEICMLGPQVMKGYWNDAIATEQAFRGGRFHTGDIGIMHESGYISLLDRKKDMILVGGFNVYPQRIEAVILEHASVAEVAVMGVDHAHFGQTPKAFIVLRAGVPSLTLVELLDFLEDKLSRYEMPMDLELRDSLPKTTIGKIAKQELVGVRVVQRESAPTPLADLGGGV
jgi:long-chain acyl-CoA synthetase